MAPEEKLEIVQHLERGRAEFLASVAGLSESQVTVRPDPARWSVLDCVEHVATVEERFLGWLENAKKLDEARIDKQKEAGLLERVADRSARARSPEAALPIGRFTTLAQALEQFNVNRTRSIQFAQDRSDELYYLAAEHPRFGPMNGAEFLMVITAHARRHAAQIQEVRVALEKN
ncbi:MAG TPA: DinB family protein [Bryobacteraceae bacterium]|nr:DinB family protein [Bryobacteraceae bacterium]